MLVLFLLFVFCFCSFSSWSVFGVVFFVGGLLLMYFCLCWSVCVCVCVFCRVVFLLV